MVTAAGEFPNPPTPFPTGAGGASLLDTETFGVGHGKHGESPLPSEGRRSGLGFPGMATMNKSWPIHFAPRLFHHICHLHRHDTR